MSINDIKNMPLQERMQLMEALWDSFVYDNATSSPQWHEEILDNRRQKMQEGTVKTFTLAELQLQR